jgi:uncharacterized protein YijF (DUF1287 family)
MGNANNWDISLPKRGWSQVTDPRPGDILQWDSYNHNTYGHVGILAEHEGKLRLVSNLGGRLGFSGLPSGFKAFRAPGGE